MKIFLILLGIYVLYKFIVDFAIPIYRTSKKVQEQFRNMHNMNENIHAQQRPAGTTTHAQEPRKNSQTSKDYIDFEEVKD
jgi:hypothetical protein